MNTMNIGRFTGCYLPEDTTFDDMHLWVQFEGTSDAALRAELDKQLNALAALDGGCEETLFAVDVENGAAVVDVFMYAEHRDVDNEYMSFAWTLTADEVRGFIELYCNEYGARLAQVHNK